MIDKLNEVLKEIGVSKVRLAKFLGVSRQMIYNYLELESVNKWPKDKKLMLLNLLGVKTPEEIQHIKVDTDYIYAIDLKLNDVVTESNVADLTSLNKKEKILLQDVMEILKDKITSKNGYSTVLYLYHFLQSMDSSKELEFMLGYVSKAAGFTKPLDFTFDKEQQFIFESILFSAFNLYNSGKASMPKIASTHERFVAHIEQKKEEEMSRTLEFTTNKERALKELNLTKITEENLPEVLKKMAEIETRKVGN